MDPNEVPGPSGSAGDNEQPPTKKKKKGPYKGYLLDQSVPIPRTTLISRSKSQGQAAVEPNQDPEMPMEEGVNIQYPAIEDVAIRGDLRDEVLRSDREISDPGESSDVELNEPGEPPQDFGRGDAPDQLDAQRAGKKSVNYIEKYQLNEHEQLHKDFSATRLDVLLMILHLAVRHCNTENFVKDQIKFVNTLFGENTLDISYHIYQQLFKPHIKIVKHYFCVDCEVIVGSSDALDDKVKFVKCPKCGKEVKVNSIDLGNYFIIFSIGDQIQDLLKKPNVKVIPHLNRNTDILSDILDGELYRELIKLGFPLANENALTVTFNTDGVAVFKSTPNSLWPIWLHVNEICPEERFKTENLILGGLWFGKGAPNMSMFLKPFISSLLDLSVNGVDYVKPDGSIVKCPVFPLACSVDSVAKPKLPCKKQFNAYCACLYCFHPNDSFIGNDKLHRYYDTSVKYDLRTEESVIRDMYKADQLQRQNLLKDKSVNGFLGISVLLVFSKLLDSYPANTFHIVWGVVIDYLHCLLEGVASDLFSLLDNILTPEQVKKIDDRLKKLLHLKR